MCLAIPALVVEKQQNDGKVKIGEITRTVRFDLVDDISVGDYVLLHAGYAIEKIDKQSAQENMEMINRL